ncbi:MAG: ATP-binding protein [Planctomycetota bacterium]
MAVLKATRGLAPGTICKLTSEAVVFGRNPKVCDVVLDHFAVSREHARIQAIDGERYLEDLGSHNGVLINGKALKPGAEGRRRLHSGDRIEIAAFEFVYDEDPSTDDLVFMADDAEQPSVLSVFDCSADSWGDEKSSPRLGKLRTLVGIIEDLSHELALDRVLPKIMASLFRAFPQTQAGCVLLRDAAGELTPVVAHVSKGAAGPMRVSRTIVAEAVHKRAAILTSTTSSDSSTKYPDDTEDSRRNSVISAPLLNGSNDVLGVIQLEVADGNEQFSQSDLELLGAVARHLAVVLENSRLHNLALREQRSEFEARFRTLIEESMQGILIHRLFKPLFVNEAWAVMHGYSVQEVLDMESTLKLIAPHERERAMQFAQARLRGENVPPRYEAQELRRDGSTLWVEKFISVIEWDGQPAAQSSLIDLSQRKQAEEALQQAHDELECRVQQRTAELAAANRQLEAEILERKNREEECNGYAAELERSNRDLEQFAYSVSHDLQAPLRTITCYCELLQRRYGGQFDTEADEFLGGAVDGAKRMKRLLDDLLAFSRVGTEARPFLETDCNVVVAEVRNNLQAQIRETGAELTSDSLPVVVGDRSQLMQLFQNLIGNAIAYRSERPPRIHISHDNRPTEWEFCVTDNGIGIEERQYERIFQIFQRLFTEDERPGSGIGLSICKRIVERHGGNMWLTSQPGTGSKFYFTIAKQSTQSSEAEAE